MWSNACIISLILSSSLYFSLTADLRSHEEERKLVPDGVTYMVLSVPGRIPEFLFQLICRSLVTHAPGHSQLYLPTPAGSN